MDLKDKVLGTIVGAAVGDAMGAPTEMRTKKQIVEKFGGYVKDFMKPPEDVFARGRKAGQVTDDFSVAYYILKAIIKNDGRFNEEIMKEGLLAWSNDEEYFEPFAGPTTRKAVEKMLGKETTTLEDFIINYNGQGTNGSAMRVFPVGLINYKKGYNVISDTIISCKPTHFNNLSIAGACAISSAVSKALEENVTLDDIFDSALKAAEIGNAKGVELGRIAAGPSMVKRIEWAIKIGKESTNFDELLDNISDYIGSGIHICESVPAVFGLIAGVEGNTMEGIYAGVNVGNDTDTVATMIGAILGAFNGIESIAKGYLEKVNKANGMKLEEIAQSITKYIEE